MKVKVYGSRGSVPISNPKSARYGGNTTCLRIYSDCLPKGKALLLDSGSGFVPASYDILSEDCVDEVFVLYTHWHHDHTQGLFLSPLLYMKQVKLNLYGPIQYGVDPKQMLVEMMKPPYFPVPFKKVESHITAKGIEIPETMVMAFHPQGGFKLIPVNEYERLLQDGKFLPIGKGKYPQSECLVITMHVSNHPEETISYRIVENPTSQVFVLLTDHENQSSLPLDMRRHIQNAHLLIMDAQYDEKTYTERTGGFGHGTPRYCVWVARETGAKKLGFTHHDPRATDDQIEAIFKEGCESPDAEGIKIFPCSDYLLIDVGN